MCWDSGWTCDFRDDERFTKRNWLSNWILKDKIHVQIYFLVQFHFTSQQRKKIKWIQEDEKSREFLNEYHNEHNENEEEEQLFHSFTAFRGS